jgi:hypothetical protein
MQGFVDVSGMSYQDVKRMGQMDDDVDYQPRQRRAAPAPVSRKFSVSDVWAAACAAQRINGEYLKEGRNTYGDNGQVLSTKRRNRDIMIEFLNNPGQLLVEDVEQGEQVRNFLQNDLTFRAIKGKLTEFDSAVSKVLAVKEEFDTFKNKYELAVVAALPTSANRTQAHQNQIERVRFARGGFIGQAGDKITAQVEVLGAVFSKNYGVYWIKGITDKDQPVFFSSKNAYDSGTWLSVQGTVKAHRDDVTQFTRVKVL